MPAEQPMSGLEERMAEDLGELVDDGPEPLGTFVTPSAAQTAADEVDFDPYTQPEYTD